MNHAIFQYALTRGLVVIGLFVPLLAWAGSGPVQVKIKDEKSTEVVLPLDPVKAVAYQAMVGMNLNVRVDNRTMHLGNIITTFKIDNQVVYPRPVGAIQPAVPLPKTPSGKVRDGVMQTFQHGQLTITQTVEVVAGKPARPQEGQKRRLDSVLIRYTVENKDSQPHSFAARVYMNNMIGNTNNRNIQGVASNQPNKLLNGVEIKGDKVPEYLQLQEKADLKNPGAIGYLTYRFPKHLEKPSRLILTSLGGGAPDGWNFQVKPAAGAIGTILAMYWDPTDIKPGTKRELAYAYGGGIASSPEGEGLVSLSLGGSFEPGKLFTVTAKVYDPAYGQSLTLVLPEGMERVEGKECQPVPPGTAEEGSQILWKARVLRTGEYRLRVQSSTGVTHTKIITITRP